MQTPGIWNELDMSKERGKAWLAGVRGDCCKVDRDHQIFVGHGLKKKKIPKLMESYWKLLISDV